MELVAVIFMLAAGGAIAVFVAVAAALARRADGDANNAPREFHVPDRDRMAASLLFQILLAGGVPDDVAMRDVRRGAGIAAPVQAGIDVANWGERYAQLATPQQRAWLLETAVQLVAARSQRVPLRQYVALLDLSFALGFQTDALAKLRERYGFDYVDHAKAGRPREADRAGRTTFFARDPRQEQELLGILGVAADPRPTRAAIVAAYRRLAAQHHPDKFYAESDEAQRAAAARFIEITVAYEALLAIYRD